MLTSMPTTNSVSDPIFYDYSFDNVCHSTPRTDKELSATIQTQLDFYDNRSQYKTSNTQKNVDLTTLVPLIINNAPSDRTCHQLLINQPIFSIDVGQLVLSSIKKVSQGHINRTYILQGDTYNCNIMSSTMYHMLKLALEVMK